MEIETANSSDLERIVHLKMAMFKEAGIEHLLHEDSRDRIYQDYREMYSNNDAIHYAIRVDGIIVSIAGAFIKSDIPYRYFKNSEYGFIGDVYTVSEFRRNGLATRLTGSALAWLENRSVTSVRLLAAPAAKSIYTKLGFKRSDEMVLDIGKEQNTTH